MFKNYLNAIKDQIISGNVLERNLRAAINNLLNEIIKENNLKLLLTEEPEKKEIFGTPDFKITSSHNIIGYIETKKIGEDLDKIIKSDQIKKYQELSDNILLTNYLEWVWIKDKTVNNRAVLCDFSDLEKSKYKLESSKIEAVSNIISNFFSQPPIGISDSKKLANVLAIRAKYLKAFILEELENEDKKSETSKLSGLYSTFRDFVFDQLSLSEFADAFSQTLVYGLFLAKLNAETNKIDLYNAKKFIPQSFILIKELVNFLDELDNEEYKPIRWIVEEVLTVVNNLDLESIYSGLSFKTRKKDQDDFTIKDPYVYFYEDFLGAYDSNLRKSKGVYFTPPAIVNFIIDSIDEIIRKMFEVKEGLADHKKITVLDFSTGTGTFLVEIIQKIFETLPKGSGKRKLLIKEHILKNLYGFEYMIAPYTISHLKLSQYLKDEGYDLQADERFQIYLTNTLVPMDGQLKIPLLPALSKEIESAQKVKDFPVLVITGNPPYSIKSKNTGDWITQLLKGIDISSDGKKDHQLSYYMVDGKPLNERQNWLRDDYVKFISFAQWKMQKVENGIIGIITNHTFLDGITFGGMRQSLLNSFDQMFFLDLHGSAKKEENVPDGIRNDPVFDIGQGVSISFFIKKRGLDKKVYHADMWGSRVEKYKQCFENSIFTLDWKEINPVSPYYFFVPRTGNFKEKYDTYWSVTKIFKEFSLPIMTGNDQIAIQFRKDEIEVIVNDVKSITEDELKNKYKMNDKKMSWIVNSKKEITMSNFDASFFQIVSYRPFDKRITYFTGKSNGFHSRPGTITKHMLYENIGMLLPRQLASKSFQHVFCTGTIPDYNCISTSQKEANQLFPLYIYYEDIIGDKWQTTRKSNFTDEFNKFISTKYKSEFKPEQIFGYIYAVLHSETYREKYFEFLKDEFAKIPFVSKIDDFRIISEKGTELVNAHLLKSFTKSGFGIFMGEGSNVVDKIEYNEMSKTISMNKSQCFENVPVEVYNFKIGGFKPIYQFLKSRKGRSYPLTLDEIETVENIINVIAFTIEKMEEIEELTKDWI
ncbi:MAG TPA: N-6 DNA methylase [Clostridiales bacterium]|nr:N-6 DNA methylase [Clostridiales bacterium]HQP69290.1 N-6 DNA methylase [Clostridiales bacterium]